MNVEPAHIDQVQRGADGRMVLISAEASTVAADLARIDKGLKVRFAENGNPPFFAVYHETRQPDGSVKQDLVLTQRAYQNRFGVWEGLGPHVVEHVRKIDGHGPGGYDFVAEMERQNRRAREQRRDALSERFGPIGEQAAHAVRKDLGLRYRGRAFITTKPEAL